MIGDYHARFKKSSLKLLFHSKYTSLPPYIRSEPYTTNVHLKLFKCYILFNLFLALFCPTISRPHHPTAILFFRRHTPSFRVHAQANSLKYTNFYISILSCRLTYLRLSNKLVLLLDLHTHLYLLPILFP